MLEGEPVIAAVIVLTAPDEVLLRRALRRGRTNDTPTAVTRRLSIYQHRTAPLLGFYGNLVVTIKAIRTPR